MVAAKWNLDTVYMLDLRGPEGRSGRVPSSQQCWTALFSKELRRFTAQTQSPHTGVPVWMVAVHIGFLAAIVTLAHHPAAFVGIFLLFAWRKPTQLFKKTD